MAMLGSSSSSNVSIIPYNQNQIPSYSSISSTGIADRISGSIGLISQNPRLELNPGGFARRAVDFTVLSAPIFTKLALGYLPLIAKPFAFSTRSGVDAAVHAYRMLTAESKAQFLKHGYRVAYSTIKYVNNLWMMELALTVAAPALSREISDTIYGTIDSLIDKNVGSGSSDQMHISLPIDQEKKARIEGGATFDIVRNADNQLEIKVKEDRRAAAPRARASATRARTSASRARASAPRAKRPASRLVGVAKKSSAKKTITSVNRGRE
ncbi:MAG: hypothetical protein K1060chlam1_00983 [Candidatus Anoxychlamydiales bacterium]|nr:hypothetical protein [Candidatus Anoxychlamydiales bacterium]